MRINNLYKENAYMYNSAIILSNYKIIRSLQAGMLLNGDQSKMLHLYKASVHKAYVLILKNEAYLLNVTFTVIPREKIKLLINRSEIVMLDTYMRNGKSLVAINICKKNNMFKATILICDPIKKYDKKKRIIEKMHRREAKEAGAYKIKIK